MIKAIFTQLGVDSSIVYQLADILFFLVAAKFIFLKKLLFVLKLREEKTVRLEEQATKNFEKVENLSEEYKEKKDSIYDQCESEFNAMRKEKKLALEAELKEFEQKLKNDSKFMWDQFAEDMEKKKSELFSEKEVLSDLLINKLAK